MSPKPGCLSGRKGRPRDLTRESVTALPFQGFKSLPRRFLFKIEKFL